MGRLFNDLAHASVGIAFFDTIGSAITGTFSTMAEITVTAVTVVARAAVGTVGLVAGAVLFAESTGEGADRVEVEELPTATKAPAIPSEDDGFIPAKKWDGESKIRSENGRGYGYPAKDGSIWVPTGIGPLAHGGPHWDVQLPNGKHKNVYPGDKIR